MALPPYASTGQRVWHYTFRVICGLLFFFLIFPIIVIIPLSFNAEDFFTFTPEMLSLSPEGYSLKHYKDFFGNSDWQNALRNSFSIAPVATLLSAQLVLDCAGRNLAFGQFRHSGGDRAQPIARPVPGRDHGDTDLADDRSADHFGGRDVLLLLAPRPSGHLRGRCSCTCRPWHALRDHHRHRDADRL
jgi:hypothetical protein